MNKNDGTPMPLFLARATNTPKNKSLFQIEYILRIAVTAESPLPGPQPCSAISTKGLATRNRPPRYHKCMASHHYKECPRPKGSQSTEVKCCNCGRDHPANYRACPKYPKPTGPTGATRRAIASIATSVAPAPLKPIVSTQEPHPTRRYSSQKHQKHHSPLSKPPRSKPAAHSPQPSTSKLHLIFKWNDFAESG